MKRFIKRSIFLTTLGLICVLAVQITGAGFDMNQTGEPKLTVTQALASEKGLKSGMIDPVTGKKIKYWAAPMDPTYIRNQPGKSPMGMDLVPVYEEEGQDKEPASTIRIDPVTIQNMGVRLARVKHKPLVKYIRTFGNITYDERRIYTVNTKFNGWIEKLYVDFVGEAVKKGQPLFDIYSPELVTAQEEYLLSVQHNKSLKESPYASIREGAQRLLDASRTRLKYWDLSDKQIKKIENAGSVQKTLTIYSPARGVVINKNAFQGHYVKAGEHQYEIADLSKVWVDVDIYEYELPWIRNGMPAKMELSYIPGKIFAGKVLYVYPFLTAKTRTAKLRLEFPNPDFHLKPNMYANVELESAIAKDVLVIPQEAVIDSGIRKIVFVALDKGKFQPREVKLGIEGNDNEFQVLEGLHENEQIVISAQFMLDSESRLREAIQKMLKVRQQSSTPASAEPMKMEADDLDMSDMTMDDTTETSKTHQHE
ncbi:MAG: efflux RND transporter periplasmic adaptor subunit [Desulfobacterales bacterium]|jgi:Cu(I)/Ag(I) efflux system membrane fusion protein/cobalt-zinc-cadmium efflux system membrane fusion protein